MAAVTKPIALDETLQAVNDTLGEIRDALEGGGGGEYIPKVAGATAGNVPTLKADGTLEDSGETIPSKTSDLTNDSNYVSDAAYVHTDNNYTSAEKTSVGQISQIKNDLTELDNTIKANSFGEFGGGKNLFDPNSLIQGDYDGTNLAIRVTIAKEYRIPAKSNTSYAVSWDKSTNITVWFVTTDENNNIIQYLAQNQSTDFTVQPSTDGYICLIFGRPASGSSWEPVTVSEVVNANCQLELGNSFSPYEPHILSNAKLSENLIRSNKLLSDAWDSTKTYYPGNYCIFNNQLWKCLVQNSGQTPTEGTYWHQTSVFGEMIKETTIYNETTDSSGLINIGLSTDSYMVISASSEDRVVNTLKSSGGYWCVHFMQAWDCQPVKNTLISEVKVQYKNK